MTKIVQHHVKYKEIHGIDEVVLMPYGEHIKLHKRLRKEGKCTIPRAELNSISHKASARLDSSKEYSKKYRQTHIELYRLCDKKRLPQKNEYRRKYIKYLEFNTTIEKHLHFTELIKYNLSSNTLSVTSRFRSSKGKLLVIEETC